MAPAPFPFRSDWINPAHNAQAALQKNPAGVISRRGQGSGRIPGEGECPGPKASMVDGSGSCVAKPACWFPVLSSLKIYRRHTAGNLARHPSRDRAFAVWYNERREWTMGRSCSASEDAIRRTLGRVADRFAAEQPGVGFGFIIQRIEAGAPDRNWVAAATATTPWKANMAEYQAALDAISTRIPLID
jgi:hypothetical protein